MRSKILYFSLLVLCTSATLQAQNKIPLLQALQIVKESFHIHLAYDGNAIQDIEVEMPTNMEDLYITLEYILEDTPLDYQIFQKNQVLIREKQIVTNENQKFSKNLIRIRGKVIDAHSKEPLAYALVLAGKNGAGTESDENGSFVLLLDEAETALLIRYIGYDNEQLLVNQSQSEIIIELNPNPVSLGDVLVEERSAPFSQPLNKNEIKYNNEIGNQMTAFGSDVFRNISLLAGINIQDDLASEISIRGGDTDENWILFDGIPLYNISHYFGIFSNVNSNVLEETTIYKNAFPVEYGGRTSGIVKMESKKMEGKKIHGGAELNILNTSAYLELPIDKKIHLLFGGRMSNKNLATTDLFSFVEENTITGNNDRIRLNANINSEPTFDFQDANAKLQIGLSDNTSLSASAFYGNDDLNYNYILDYEGPAGVVMIDETYAELQNWQSKGINFNIDHKISEEWTFNTS
ncbi:MAG: carboxypeptidase-like regulatory domain-containing protein, partial [Bacteroidota bacterium]